MKKMRKKQKQKPLQLSCINIDWMLEVNWLFAMGCDVKNHKLLNIVQILCHFFILLANLELSSQEAAPKD